MIIICFAIMVLVDVFHHEIALFFLKLYLFTDFTIFQMGYGLFSDNEFYFRAVLTIPVVIICAIHSANRQ